jgi:O-antigen ligase
MNDITSISLFFLAAGILTSVSILSGYQVLFAIPLFCYTYLAVKSKDLRLPKSSYWLIAFAVIALISLVINFDLVPKPSKNFGRIKYFAYGVCGIFVLRAWLVDASDKTKKILCNTFFLSIVIAALYACYQLAFSTNRRAQGLTETMRYGYGSSMILATLFSALLQREKIKGWFDARFGLIAFIFGFIGMYATYTRGGLLGFLCALPVAIYFFRAKYGLAVGGVAILIVGALGGFYFFGSINSDQEGSRWLINKNNTSDQKRKAQWKAAVIAIQEKPVLGYGFANFHSQVKRIKTENNLEVPEYNDAHAHNLFLEIASGTGIIGLIAFLGWIIVWAYECFTEKNLVRALVIPFGIAWVISSQFEVTLDANNASMIFFVYALSLAKHPKKV